MSSGWVTVGELGRFPVPEQFTARELRRVRRAAKMSQAELLAGVHRLDPAAIVAVTREVIRRHGRRMTLSQVAAAGPIHLEAEED